jgi:ribosomal protein L1
MAEKNLRFKTPVPMPPGQDLERMVKRCLKTVVVQLRKIPQVSCLIGPADESDEKLAANAEAVLSRVVEKLEKRIRNIGSIYLKTTMGKTFQRRDQNVRPLCLPS